LDTYAASLDAKIKAGLITFDQVKAMLGGINFGAEMDANNKLVVSYLGNNEEKARLISDL
jgi:hypothetical protein